MSFVITAIHGHHWIGKKKEVLVRCIGEGKMKPMSSLSP